MRTGYLAPQPLSNLPATKGSMLLERSFAASRSLSSTVGPITISSQASLSALFALQFARPPTRQTEITDLLSMSGLPNMRMGCFQLIRISYRYSRYINPSHKLCACGLSAQMHPDESPLGPPRRKRGGGASLATRERGAKKRRCAFFIRIAYRGRAAERRVFPGASQSFVADGWRSPLRAPSGRLRRSGDLHLWPNCHRPASVSRWTAYASELAAPRRRAHSDRNSRKPLASSSSPG